MIVYDKEQKEIVIPNGIGNINLFNNGVEAGYNEGYEQGQADSGANARVLNVTENGVYKSKYSDPIIPTVTGVYADGTEFYNYAQLTNKVFNTKIAGSVDSRLEFWYKGDNIGKSDGWDIIIGSGDFEGSRCFIVRYFAFNNDKLCIEGTTRSFVLVWDDTVWHHLIISKTEGIWVDGKKVWDFSPSIYLEGEFFINGIGYNTERNANGYFGMIKIDDTIIIPTANGFLNTNTGELLEVVKDGGYTFTENQIIYGEGELYKTINVNVPDLNGSYDEGYAQGKTDGINEQKSKLESISITENGTYRKEDGYNEVVVNVADLNGSYDEGYEQGQADVAANARVLNVTENGSYVSKYTEEGEIVMPFDLWGDDFYSYAYIKNKIYNTGIIPNENTRLEFWFKPDEGDYLGGSSIVIMNNAGSVYGNIFGIFHQTAGDQSYYANVGGDSVNFNLTNGVLYHIVLSVADGLVINGEQIGTFSSSSNFSEPLYINGISNDLNASADGDFGMIKIDDTIIIPTKNGFLNQNTNELLEVVYDGGVYNFTGISKPTIEGNLYRTINVDVIPKINVKEAGLKFGESSFTEVPEWADFEGITDMSNMFSSCESLQTIPLINTSNVTNMERMFGWCRNLQTIPLLDTSKVTNASSMFYNCSNLITLPNNFNFSSCTTFSEMFFYAGLTDYSFLENWVINPNASMDSMIENTNTTYVPAIPCVGNGGYQQSAIFWAYGDFSKLTYFGGWIGRKYNITQDYILKKMTALSYESCISILNNLYDFTGNGETPNSEQGQLKVAQSFIDTVGDEISIATSKGWVVSV